MISASLQSKIPDSITSFCVGSLPFTAPDEAVAFVQSTPWIFPFWPELPQRDPAEFMVPRSDRALLPAWHGYSANEASGLFATIKVLENVKRIVPILKGQLLGPLSHAFFSEELEGDVSAKLRAATNACMRQMEWQIAALKKSCGSLLLVLDEPGFIYWDKLSDDERALAKEQLTYLYVSAGERDCYLGIHSCAPLPKDFFSLPFDLFSFDALTEANRNFRTTLPAAASSAGFQPVLVPGVVPAATSENFEKDLLAGRARYSELKGQLSPDTRMLFSATCGHGLASQAWVKFLYQNAQNAR